VYRVLAHMQTHLEEKQSSEGLASVALLSPFHFNRVFRQLTGIPPACFLAALRLEKAKSLLLTTEASVTDICFDVGYTSLGTFVSRFTQMVGISPNGLRRAARSMTGADLRDIILAKSFQPLGSMSQVRGYITGPSQFRGMIIVGVYENLLPHARPLQCTVLTGPGGFTFDDLPRGTYVVAAAALPYEVNPAAFLNNGVTLRIASMPVGIEPGRDVPPVALTLRGTTLFDPPILAPLPLMMLARANEPPPAYTSSHLLPLTASAPEAARSGLTSRS
jgi:AraC-like DNA-binding protein